MKLDGKILMKHFQLSPGPHIGKILQQCFERVMGDIATRNDTKTLLQYAKSLL